MNDVMQSPTVEAPTKPGFYVYDGGAQIMVFLLAHTYDGKGQWYCALDNGTMEPCVWAYIEQALSVWSLVRLDEAIEPRPAAVP